MRARLLSMPVTAVVVALLLAGCSGGSSSASDDGKITVVTSTNVYGSLVTKIGGAHVDVTSVLHDPSQDPHSFESSARTQLAVSRADLLIENGGGYDDFMTTLAKSAKKKATTINVVQLSGLKKAGDDEFNEHVFYDYPTMVKLVHRIERDLASKDSADAESFEKRADALVDDLKDLESQAAALKKEYSGEKVVYTEPVPGYLFDAIGLTNATPSAFSEAIEEGDDVPPAALNDTLQLIKGRSVKMLAYNEQTSSAETEQVKSAAVSAGVPVVGVTETLPTGDNYISWQQHNVDAMRKALAR